MPSDTRARKSTTDPPLPHNPEAERCILGAVLLDNSALPLALKHLHSADFFNALHQRIFRRMIAMAEASQPIDLVTLNEAMHAAGELKDAVEVAYLAQLSDGLPRVSNVEHYAKIVKEKAVLRRFAHAGDKITRAVMDGCDLNVVQSYLRALTSESVEPMKVVGGNGHLSYSFDEFMDEKFAPPDHLIEQLIPRGGSGLIVALPHRLKSWFTTSIAMGATKPGIILGKLEVKRPVRSLLIQVEDFPGQLQWRMRELQGKIPFNAEHLRIIPRCGLNLPDEAWYQNLLREVETFRADLVIMDVLRRIFRGDINSPTDTALFLEQIDRLREATSCAVLLVHHENKKEAEIMTASAGSYNLPGWANVMIQFKRKTQEGHVTHVEIEVDNKLAQSPEPMRMVLDLTSETGIRLENVEDSIGIADARDRLTGAWTIKDLAEALEVHKSNAHRRLKKWLASGVAEKVSSGKRGRMGGMARYHFVGDDV